MTLSAGTLDLDGYSPTIGALSGAAGTNITTSVAGTAALTTNFSTGSSTFAGVIANGTGTVSLTKSGAGELVLSGANTYTGGTDVEAGTLQLGNASALGTGGLIADGGTLDLNGYSITVNSLSGSGGTITDNSTSAGDTTTLTVDQASNQTFAGTIADGQNGTLLSLVKEGTGTLALSGANTFSGTTTLSTGTLELDNASALAQSTIDLQSGSSLTFGTLTAATLGGLAGDPGVSWGPDLVLANSLGQAVALSVGNNNADSTFDGTIGGSGGLIKVGSGTLTLDSWDGIGTQGCSNQNYPYIALGSIKLQAGTLEVEGDDSYAPMYTGDLGGVATPVEFTGNATLKFGTVQLSENYRPAMSSRAPVGLLFHAYFHHRQRRDRHFRHRGQYGDRRPDQRRRPVGQNGQRHAVPHRREHL